MGTLYILFDEEQFGKYLEYVKKDFCKSRLLRMELLESMCVCACVVFACVVCASSNVKQE